MKTKEFWLNAWFDTSMVVPTDERKILVRFADDTQNIGYYSQKKKKFLSKEHCEINPIEWAYIQDYKEITTNE